MKGGGGDRQKQQQEKMEQMENMKNGILSQVVYMVNIIDQKDYYDVILILRIGIQQCYRKHCPDERAK